jgi:hypothetical protein
MSFEKIKEWMDEPIMIIVVRPIHVATIVGGVLLGKLVSMVLKD